MENSWQAIVYNPGSFCDRGLFLCKTIINFYMLYKVRIHFFNSAYQLSNKKREYTLFDVLHLLT
jgi:hypothetical protein